LGNVEAASRRSLFKTIDRTQKIEAKAVNRLAQAM